MLSYNIHRCYGGDGQYRPDRIKQVLRNSNATVIALQEVELLHEGDNVLEYFCENSPWEAIPGLTMTNPSGHYGNALLTSLPVVELRRIDLSKAGREPRGAIQVKVRYNGSYLDVTTTHLGLRPSERYSQIQNLMSQLQQNPLADTQLLLGDLNEWLRWSKTLRVVQQHFRPSPVVATFPSAFPILSLDRIWVTPNNRFKYVKAIKNRLTQVASDHLPVIAGLDV